LDTAPANLDPTNKTRAFKDAYFAAYNEVPTYTSFAAYDSVYILKDAMERSSLVVGDMGTPATVRAAIHGMLPSTHYTGAAAEIKFTSENNWGQISAYSPLYDAFNNTIVHDLFTPSNVGVDGRPFIQPFFGQWYENNTQAVIFGGSSVGYDPSINPPYVGVVPTVPPIVSTIVSTATTVTTINGTETTLTSVGTTVLTSQNTVTTTDTTDEGLPGFGLYLSIVSIFVMTLYISRTKRRKD
ncbi:MAG: ABC transporter substrate-binding protein, partial [Candidatus Kariarchaeaceae archaeon]